MWNLFNNHKPPDIEVGDLLGDEVVVEAQSAMDLEEGW
jgi:hypothetical protein